MDTKPLERFATWARRELINAVDAQATSVLAVGSIARSERAEIVKKLEAEIGRHGRQNIVDKVAYTWFNRIIALRFMDARGYTDAGVVSPAQGQAHGQPEILSDAKRGNLDTDVVTNSRTANAIIGLLDGTRRSTDAEGEAYALLLTEYCRYWHKPMPFMFEREGDYTELLVPAGILADGAILSQARVALTEEVCDDVEVIGWLYQFYISERKDEVFAGFKKNRKAGADEIPAATQLFTPHWIVRYLVENSLGRLWMLNRPASRLVDQMDYYIAPVDVETDFLKIASPEELTVIDPACGSGHMLTYAFDLLYAIYEEAGYALSEIPSLILTHNLHGTEIDPRAGSLAAFALTMKARAKQRAFFSRQVEPNICVIEAIEFEADELDFLWSIKPNSELPRARVDRFWNTFEFADVLGSLLRPNEEAAEAAGTAVRGAHSDEIVGSFALRKARRVLGQAAYLTRRYAVAVANPPYMGSKNMDTRLAQFVKENYPNGKQDLYGCFVLRAMDFTLRSGFVAKVIGDTWMSIQSFKDLRTDILAGHSFDSFVHLRDVSNHPDVFGANAAFVLAMTNTPRRRSPFIRLTSLNSEEKRKKLVEAISHPDRGWRFSASSTDFVKLPGSPIAYWLSDAMRAAFSEGQPLSDSVPTREGLTTGENSRFLRYWHEVGSSTSNWGPAGAQPQASTRWFRYLKGGDFRKWWGNFEYVVDWERDGERARLNVDPDTGRIRSHNYNGEFAFREGFTWTGVSSGGFSGRLAPEGFMFDATAPMAFPATVGEIESAMAILNSSSGGAFLSALSPTLHFKLGTVMSVPLPPRRRLAESLPRLVVPELVSASREDWSDFETSWDFTTLSLFHVGGAALSDRLEVLSRQWRDCSLEQQARETENNRIVAEAYGLQDEVPIDAPLHRVSLTRNVEFTYGPGKSVDEYAGLERADVMRELISYSVGCMFGRYSLDEPGLILADPAATLPEYLAKVPSPSFRPDIDNVIPFVDDGWFDDDIVDRFRQFLRTAFGAERFEENVRFVEETLGVKSLRDYFITSTGKSKFYDDHVQRYKKRPIYWMFSSPKGSFNALIYMHRYTPSTVSTVLNEYLREYRAKLEVALANAEQAAVGGGSVKEQKEADRLRKVLVELAEYEHDVLYPLATQQIVIDLDDGVKANYPKFHPALKNIAGLEATE